MFIIQETVKGIAIFVSLGIVGSFNYFIRRGMMKSEEYRYEISRVIRNSIHKKFPGLKRILVAELGSEIARAIHARFYGSDVDGVGSPIWRDHESTADCNRGQPTKTAQDLLDD